MTAEAPIFRVRSVELFEWPFQLRLPFRFGVITVTHGRQAVARVRITLPDGREGFGVAAESLAAKWFDKNPTLSDDDNLEQLRRALHLARDLYLSQGTRSGFGHAAAACEPMLEEAGRQGLPRLVAAFGPALLDRAIADALGRLLGQSFHTMVQSNALGIAPMLLAPDLAGFAADAFLAGLVPQSHLHVRHTVGMLDPITAADQPTRVGDGLPETLEEIIAAYGHRYFKLKVGGDLPADLDRLRRTAAVLDRVADYHATLDGNEQYETAEQILELLDAIDADPALARLRRSLLFVEQPIKRAVADERDITELARRAPVMIDESDGTYDAFPRASALGYTGISSKNCKGFYKSLINLMRCASWNAPRAQPLFFMSAEDLTTLAGVSVQQDLALASLLGVSHIERNGHHFIDGFAGRPPAEARAFLSAHPDLYRLSDDRVRLRIEQGQVAIGSLDTPGFATAAQPDFSAMESMSLRTNG